jgi:hypothetical protein
METFILVSLIIHVTAGCLALLSGLAAILLRNNVKKHRPFGKIYFWCMTVIFVTAIYISVYRSNVFLFCVAFFTYYSCLTAYRSLKLKKLHTGQKASKTDWAIESLFGFMHMGMIVFGITLYAGGNSEFGIITLVFGTLGLRGNYLNIKRLRGNITYSNYWLLTHISGMLGSYIGAITAFLVNNNARWIHMPQVAAWLGPAVILAPLIVYEVNRFKKKAALVKS